MRSRLILLVLFCFSFLSATFAQKKVDTAKKVVAIRLTTKDSSVVKVRKFNDEQIITQSKEKDFIYDDVAPPQQTWWDRFWDWFWDLFSNIFEGKSYSPILKWTIIGLVVAGLVYFALRLAGVDLKVLVGKSKQVNVPYDERLENIHEIDFDEQLETAIKNGNYRAAVRLLYLKTLKKLTDAELIFWQPEKTNQAYVAELGDSSYQEEFTSLTNAFEYVWYGEFHIDKESFEKLNKSFLTFNTNVR